jgi:hypothetical protein
MPPRKSAPGPSGPPGLPDSAPKPAAKKAKAAPKKTSKLPEAAVARPALVADFGNRMYIGWKEFKVQRFIGSSKKNLLEIEFLATLGPWENTLCKLVIKLWDLRCLVPVSRRIRGAFVFHSYFFVGI